MAEYIDRQAVLDDLANLWDWDSVDGIQTSTALKQVITDVKNVPAADVRENKYGRWIGYPECLKFPNAYADDHIVCSECEECFSILDNDCERFDFCPHCGADMREKDNDEKI